MSVIIYEEEKEEEKKQGQQTRVDLISNDGNLSLPGWPKQYDILLTKQTRGFSMDSVQLL